MIKVNVGTVDQWMRILAGLVIISLAFWGPKSPWAWLGLIPLATGLVKWCPAYALFGVSTCKTNN
jgi:membrane protein implicated in regulation of membrane protease activity